MKHPQSFWRSGPGFAAMGLIGVASYFLWIEHRQHVVEFLPYMLILACPLMHVFMHRGHTHHHSRDGDQASPPSEDYQRGYDDAMKKRTSGHTHPAEESR